MTERRLAELFDYQRFENREKLSLLIAETEARISGACPLSDEELEISAAGDPFLRRPRKKDGEDGGDA